MEHATSTTNRDQRRLLDQLYTTDAIASMTFGLVALLAPHIFIAQFTGGAYNHSVHETLRYVLFDLLYFLCEHVRV
jgi:hypothetical protein